MKKLLIFTFAILFSVVSFAQVESDEIPLNIDSLTSLDPTFNDGTPEANNLYIYGLRNSFQSAKMLNDVRDLTDRLDTYRKKRNVEQGVGIGLIALGTAGLWYVAEMKEPIYLTGDPNDLFLIENNKKADQQKRDRRIVAWPSAGLVVIGSVLIVDSFKFNRWTKLDLRVTNVKITQELFGGSSHKRQYFTDKEEKLIKKKSLYRNSFPRYRQ